MKKSQCYFIGTVGLLIVGTAWGASAGTEAGKAELDPFTMSMGLLGGLALFLFGMGQMANSLKALAGEGLKGILARLTTNRVTGVLTGALVTGIIQSSSVTTVLTVGFITAGVLSLSQAVGIIFGSNVGTTLTAQIIAFKITHYSLLMIAVGFAMLFVGKQDKVKQYGTMIMGLGLIFFGMGVMSGAMKPLRTYGPFLNLMTRMESPLLGIAVAAAFTALVQSSSATTGIVIAMASQGLIALPTGIALIFGANIGTCVTALLASLGKPREAVRASLVHVLFNVLGVVLWVGFIGPLAALVTHLSPAHPELAGGDRMAIEIPRQIANAHTIFNVANTLIFLPFAGLFARLAERLVPDRKVTAEEAEDEVASASLLRLDPSLLMMPSLAQEQARGAIADMAGIVRGMLADIAVTFSRNDIKVIDDIAQRDHQVDAMNLQITDYLISVTRRYLVHKQSEENVHLLYVTGELEHIGDLLERNMTPLLRKKADADISFSEEGRREILEYHQRVLASFDQAIEAFVKRNADQAQQVVAVKPELVALEHAYRRTHYDRLSRELRESAETSQIHLDLIDYLRRINSYAEAIARTLLGDEQKEEEEERAA